jgi:homoserine dehydrogenase
LRTATTEKESPNLRYCERHLQLYLYQNVEDNNTFEEALKKRNKTAMQRRPDRDIKSFDALYKTVILSMFGFGKHFDYSLIRTTPYSRIDLFDMKFAASSATP